MFSEEDTNIFTELLRLYYDFFSLFHDSFRAVFEKDPEQLQIVLGDFTKNFEKYFFNAECSKSGPASNLKIGSLFFNLCVYRGFYFCPLDCKSYLYATKCLNTLMLEFPICKMAVFYEEFFLFSDLPQDQVEIMHTYLFGMNVQRREGYRVGPRSLF